VNTLIMASVSSAALRVRRNMTYPLASLSPASQRRVRRGLRGQWS
jgi:hypothetical protein